MRPRPTIRPLALGALLCLSPPAPGAEPDEPMCLDEFSVNELIVLVRHRPALAAPALRQRLVDEAAARSSSPDTLALTEARGMRVVWSMHAPRMLTPDQQILLAVQCAGALERPDAADRVATLRLISGCVEDPTLCWDAMERCLDDSDPVVREYAGHALRRFGLEAPPTFIPL